MALGMTFGADEQFEYALDVLLDGIEQRRRRLADPTGANERRTRR